MMDMACHSLDSVSHSFPCSHSYAGDSPHTLITVSVLRLIVNVKVQADKQYTGYEEGNKCEEDQLLQEARLFELNREFVLLLAQLVTLSLQKGIANIIHNFFIFFLNQ